MSETNVVRKCKIDGCKRPYKSKGYCGVHYRKWRRGELDSKPRYKTCSEENCNKPMFKMGYCEQHYSAWIASKHPERAKAESSAKPAIEEVAPKVEPKEETASKTSETSTPTSAE